MYIYNSLTNQKEEFRTIEPNKIKMYVCGPTVYNYLHIGNARPVIFFDVVRRYFVSRGFEVTFVSNITDVDDKIINAAIENHVSEEVLVKKYKQAFLDNVKDLNCLPFDANPNVTDYMSDIIDYIRNLEKLGYAYEVDGDVYFAVNKIPSYGKLSNQETENLEVGARITENDKKNNPLDFTLWKKTNVGIQWNSPWGKGRPGWHTECVAMINDTLGEIIDIHGGGSDLKFPHHENEIAQSEATNHNHLANYWMHNGRLMIDNEKMSKSLGNYIFITDFLSHYRYHVLRLFMLSTHYRQPLNYTIDVVENMKNDLEKIEYAYKKAHQELDLRNKLDLNYTNEHAKNFLDEFNEAMDDDFNTANAITVIMKIVKALNILTRTANYDVNLSEIQGLFGALHRILAIFGIEFEIRPIDDETKDLINKRNEARINKDFETADKFRAILQKKGIII